MVFCLKKKIYVLNFLFCLYFIVVLSSLRDFIGELICDSVVLSWSYLDDSGGFFVISYVIIYSNNIVVIFFDLIDFIVDNLKYGIIYKIGI